MNISKPPYCKVISESKDEIIIKVYEDKNDKGRLIFMYNATTTYRIGYIQHGQSYNSFNENSSTIISLPFRVPSNYIGEVVTPEYDSFFQIIEHCEDSVIIKIYREF
jgi:hypothetical protein